MTERERVPPTPKADPPASGEQTGAAGAPQKQRLVGMYDRPERTGPSPMLLIVLALIVLALIVGAVYFIF